MHPELFHFRYFGEEHHVYSYGVMMVLGMAGAIGLAAKRAPRYGVPSFDEFAVGVLCAIAGVAGAALLFLVVNLRAFLVEPAAFLHGPGMVFYGGFLAAAPTAFFYARHYRLSLGAIADAAAPALPLGHALGRIGCFLGGCCFGRPTRSSIGVVFTDPRAPATSMSRIAGALHPVQLYEAGGLVLLSLLLLALTRPLRRQPMGMLFFGYMLGYALLRLATESFRGDFVERGALLGGRLSTSQAIALLLVVVSIGLVWSHRRRANAS